MEIVILDLGINNITSVERAILENISVLDHVKVIENPEELEVVPDLIILPGLGSFESGMAAIQSRGFFNFIRTSNASGIKIVGICLGMQLLFESSEESPDVQGLHLLNGRVEKLPEQHSERIPNIGWQRTNYHGDLESFKALQEGLDFYFVHSYAVLNHRSEETLSTTSYGDIEFVSSLKNKNLIAYQFHPEKSGKVGRRLISETIQWAREN
jgi:glutamine amidotransferase